MPPLSFVLVVHREQGFVRAALRSILDQASRDVQVVVVANAAADHSGEIAADEASRDDRICVVELAERAEPAAARRAGLAQVTGAYVWFVDPIDLLPDRAVTVVEAALEVSPVDVLVVSHTVRDVYGRERPGPEPATSPLTSRLWDKVVRTEFLRTAGEEGMHRAGAVSVVAENAYVRRDVPAPVRRRSGDGLRAVGAGSTPTQAARGTALRRTFRRLVADVRRPRRTVNRLRVPPLRAWYQAQLRAPLRPDLAVFAAYWYSAYSCNPRAIYEKTRELRPHVRGVWVLNPDAVDKVPPGVEHVVAGTREYYRLMARATSFVNNVNFPNDIVKRPGQVHLQTHHGTPLKVMGMDLATSAFTGRRMNFPKLMQRVARWDYSISQNAFTSEQWERVYPSGTFQSLETGYPRNDVLALATEDDVAKARAALGVPSDVTTVLYLPTHREYHPGYVPQLDAEALAERLGPSYSVLMRTHYFYRDTAGPAPSGRVLDVADHPRIEELYLASDVLVTDYSSAMFDYAVLDRPIVIYAPDWEEYRRLRGTTFDLMGEPPGAVARTEPELTEVLATRRAWDDDSAAKRAAFRKRFCSLEDGRAAERVVRILWPDPTEGRA